MEIKIIQKEKENFKITFDNNLSLLKISYKTANSTPSTIHINIIKIDEIANLFLINTEIHINTDKENFIYSFPNYKIAYNTFSNFYKRYINYYNIMINNKDLLIESIGENENKQSGENTNGSQENKQSTENR